MPLPGNAEECRSEPSSVSTPWSRTIPIQDPIFSSEAQPQFAGLVPVGLSTRARSPRAIPTDRPPGTVTCCAVLRRGTGAARWGVRAERIGEGEAEGGAVPEAGERVAQSGGRRRRLRGGKGGGERGRKGASAGERDIGARSLDLMLATSKPASHIIAVLAFRFFIRRRERRKGGREQGRNRRERGREGEGERDFSYHFCCCSVWWWRRWGIVGDGFAAGGSARMKEFRLDFCRGTSRSCRI
ncbi:hypothetical protein Mp_7g07770 [Marchantia polymorpha subsp. ruderalis]|uniref:Uncharacterized protein n=2 Tax=Marchantia polymorpha TaxID=3197 RepID=A0AAF6BX72_MARPO|nr:hypothetical protein MARPO_0076s0017 [Marchantia polymorpha]BBN16606.1 hypothetical protein Mp_7g07770 [Marchantia polymorpha subsp. ruderalis]|eukprot:PTQ34771.1 hypothetical protein MARPO_0076s0017 [Marchantia polymorpha]